MMAPKALALLRRAVTEAQRHLAFLERCAASGPTAQVPARLIPTPHMLAVARAEVARLEQMLADNTPQLPLFG